MNSCYLDNLFCRADRLSHALEDDWRPDTSHWHCPRPWMNTRLFGYTYRWMDVRKLSLCPTGPFRSPSSSLPNREKRKEENGKRTESQVLYSRFTTTRIRIDEWGQDVKKSLNGGIEKNKDRVSEFMTTSCLHLLCPFASGLEAWFVCPSARLKWLMHMLMTF